MIKPTLFVGLGTTGTKIIKSLRQLMFEEYGHAGLPVFRYIAIETDGDEKGVDPELRLTNQMDDYERIELVRATIDSTIPIYEKLKPKHRKYNPHLADWLDPELLKVETHKFDAGAKNIRMAGRLCLWENWDDMRGKVERARSAVIAHATTEKARRLLREYYQAKERPIPQEELIDSNTINTYIVGSLCGGSCSGMLIDVAYFFRSLSSGQQASDVFGMFTMFDKEHATGNDRDTRTRAANCYASLLELNYYNHTDTTYEMVFPNGDRVENMRRKPFDFSTFVSRSSITHNIRHVLPGGGFDEDGLNLMVALNLFAETAGDTDGEKAAIRTDWDGYDGIWGLKDPEIQGEISCMVKFMSTFGLTAVKYPKYRIAKAAASLVSQDLTEILLGEFVPPATVLADAKKGWQTIFTANMDRLVVPEGQQSIKFRIESELNNVIASRQISRQNAFSEKFNSGGEYYEAMKIQIPECENAYRNAIQQILNNKLGDIDFKDTAGLGDVIAYFEVFDKEIERSIQTLPERMPDLSMNLNLTPIKSVLNSWWTKSLGLQKRAASESQENAMTEYRNMIVGDRESAYQKMRNFFLRQVLENIRSELGFGVQSNNPAGTIRQRLENIRSSLNNSLQTFKNDYQSAINMRNYASVKIVTDKPQNKIKLDAEALYSQIIKSNSLSPLENGQSMNEFLAQGHEGITTQMNETYKRMALEQIPVKDVVTKAREILEAGGDENDITNMAARSNPYQVFVQGFERLAVNVPPKIICGDDSNRNVLSRLQDSLERKRHHFPRLGGSSVDHLLFFYEEEASFAMDDLNAFAMLEQQFESKPGTYGHLTHRNPDFYDLMLYHKTLRLQQWCCALGRIVPEIKKNINKEAFSDVFYQTKSGYVYEYSVNRLSERLSLYNDQDGIKRLSQKQNENDYDRFFRSVRSCFTKLNRRHVEVLIDSLLRDIEDNNEHARISQFFRQFLDDVYSEDSSLEDIGSTSVTGSAFFQQPRQTAQTESEDTSVPLSQEVINENTENLKADSGSYENISTEESEVDAGAFTQDDTEQNQETPQDTPTEHSTPNTTEDEYKWSEPTPDAEPTLKEEEPASEQQPKPDTDTQKEPSQPAKPFNVAEVNVKEVLRRDNPPKKE